jgi:hypothetical protein
MQKETAVASLDIILNRLRRITKNLSGWMVYFPRCESEISQIQTENDVLSDWRHRLLVERNKYNNR